MQNSKKIISLLGAAALSTTLYSILQVVSIQPSSPDDHGWRPELPADTQLYQSSKEHNISGLPGSQNGTASLQPSNPALDLPRPHPHAGARYPNGSFGFVADVTMVRQHIFDTYQKNTDLKVSEAPPLSYLPFHADQFDTVCNTEPRDRSLEKKAGWRLLKRMKVAGGDGGETELPSANSKILCAIYTYNKHHNAVTAIGETWGWHCDGFFAASTETVLDPTLPGFGAIDLPHNGPERYENMWMKVRSIWAYIHDNYINDYDFFYLAGDDTHLIVENLRRLLSSMGQGAKRDPLYLGHWIPDDYGQSKYFCGGGPGYVLNKKALQMLVRDILPKCKVNARTHAEDRTIGECFHIFGNVHGNSSVDAGGSQMFHGTDPHFVAHYTGDKGYFMNVYAFWAKLHGHKMGVELASNHSVSFHLLKGPVKMKRHHAILYKSCPRGTALGDALLGD